MVLAVARLARCLYGVIPVEAVEVGSLYISVYTISQHLSVVQSTFVPVRGSHCFAGPYVSIFPFHSPAVSFGEARPEGLNRLAQNAWM